MWSDEFNQRDGSAPRSSNWAYDTGGNGWGNHELQYYTDRSPNNVVIHNGRLTIRALEETHTGPRGKGLWPAFWMLGNNIKEVGWPACGEIDLLENIGGEPSTIHGTLHGPGYSAGSGIGASYTLGKKQRFADAFHVFAAEWEPGAIRFYVDDALYKTTTPANLPPGTTWVFDHPFFVILNVAVGGDWPGNPDSSTVFPQRMEVDYVRIYQRRTR